MGASITTRVRYISGMQYFSPAAVEKLAVSRIANDVVRFEFQDAQGMRGLMEVPASIATVLARVLLLVAEGSALKIETALP